jgi:hypothetical protein
MAGRLGRAIRKAKRVSRGGVRRVRECVLLYGRSASLWFRVRHVSGPRRIVRDPDDVLVICVVRNGALYINSWLNHYERLGVKHFLFLDNGSTDETIPMLAQRRGVTLLQCSAPYAHYENLMKRHIVKRYSKRKWNLFVDIDELFDYPGSGTLSLRQFIGYLDHYGYTAVVAQMLDMFGDEPISESSFIGGTDLIERQPWFDISAIEVTAYRYDESFSMHWGGIRKIVFGSNNGLTKAPLTFVDDQIRLFVDEHHTLNSRYADLTCLIRHHPFIRSFYDKVREASETGRYGVVTSDCLPAPSPRAAAAAEYRAYWAVLKNNPSLSLRSESARLFTGVDDLIGCGFLQVSRAYLDWMERVSTLPP